MNFTILFRSRTAPRLPQPQRWRRWWKTRSSRRNTEPASRTSATPRRTWRPWPRWWRWWRACSAGTERSPRRARATSRRTWWTWRQTCWMENEQVILYCFLRFIGCKDLETKEFSQIILHLSYSTSKNSLMIMNYSLLTCLNALLQGYGQIQLRWGQNVPPPPPGKRVIVCAVCCAILSTLRSSKTWAKTLF